MTRVKSFFGLFRPAAPRLARLTGGYAVHFSLDRQCCQRKGLPARKGVPAAAKYSGDVLYIRDEAAAWEGRRSEVCSAKTKALETPQPAKGGQFASPTAVTPGIVLIDSIMRFSIVGTEPAE